jgi:adenylate cyclase
MGTDIWAGRFDRDLTDIFALQDEITESVVSAIEPSLRAAEIERARAKATDNLEAYDLYLRALPEFYAFTEPGFRGAEALLRQAVERDPGYADAWGALADCRGRLMVGGWTNDWDADAARNREAALQAVQCDPDNGLVLSIAAWSLISLSGVLDQAVTFSERALYLQPNSSNVLTNCGWVLVYNDESERALACLEKARRLNPLDPRGYITLNGMGAAHFLERRFKETEQFTRRALEMNTGHPISLRYLTAALAQMGRLAEATEVGRLLQSTRWEAMRVHLHRSCYRNPEKRELLFEGLRLAGLPV